jgi:hypothetical protein
MTIILQDCFIHPSLPGDRNFHHGLLRILGALHVDRTVDLLHLWGKSWAQLDGFMEKIPPTNGLFFWDWIGHL